MNQDLLKKFNGKVKDGGAIRFDRRAKDGKAISSI